MSIKQIFPSVAKQIKESGKFNECNKLIISIMAGVTNETMQQVCYIIDKLIVELINLKWFCAIELFLNFLEKL